MNDQLTINQNTSACIHVMTNWGENIYTNVCTGAVTVVPWGAMEMFVTGVCLSILAICAVGTLITVVRS